MRVGKRMRLQRTYRRGKDKAKEVFDSEKGERVAFLVIVVLSLILFSIREVLP